PARGAGSAADAGPLDRRRQGQHPLRHAGLAGIDRPCRESAAPGVGARHRQRHRWRCARGLLHRLGAASGRAGGAPQAAAAPVGAVAAMNAAARLATQVAGMAAKCRGFAFKGKHAMAKLLVLALGTAVLFGCTTTAPAAAPPPTRPTASTTAAEPASSAEPNTPGASLDHYRCDEGVEFTVRFADDSANIDAGPFGSDVLLRDAGGTTPQQTVYSNARMRAEFGLGASGREAILRYPLAPLVAHCVRD